MQWALIRKKIASSTQKGFRTKRKKDIRVQHTLLKATMVLVHGNQEGTVSCQDLLRRKTAINLIFHDNKDRILRIIFLDIQKWHPWAIENHLRFSRGLLAKLQLQVSLSNNDIPKPSIARMKLFKRSFYIFSVDISLKISQRQPP